MSLRLELCACLLHARFIGKSGHAMEVGSREAAKFILLLAEKSNELEPGNKRQIESSIAASMMVLMDSWIEANLRRQIHLWNLASSTTNDHVAFSKTDFHAYQSLMKLDDEDDTQPD